jgi:glycosyltransferase involved in cell wall biosynthesis
MSNMKISIVTATYNSSKTVRDTIESVLSQSFQDYEYLIVDGGSKDKTLDIIREYEPKFNGRMKWKSEKDKGIYDAMNKGFKWASNEILMLINSDDLFSRDDAFQQIIDSFIAHPEADCVYADLYYVAAENTDNIVRVWKTGEQKPFRKGWLPAHPTFYVKRDVYEKYGYFNLDYSLAADFELMLRFVEKHHIKLHYLPEHLVKMRLGGATSKNLHNIIIQNRECVKAFKENGLEAGPFYIGYRMLPKIKQFLRRGNK